ALPPANEKGTPPPPPPGRGPSAGLSEFPPPPPRRYLPRWSRSSVPPLWSSPRDPPTVSSVRALGQRQRLGRPPPTYDARRAIGPYPRHLAQRQRGIVLDDSEDTSSKGAPVPPRLPR